MHSGERQVGEGRRGCGFPLSFHSGTRFAAGRSGQGRAARRGEASLDGEERCETMPAGRKGAVAFLSPQRSLNFLNPCHTNQGLLVISFKSAISIRPMHLFDHNRDHDYYFRLLREEERDAQSITRCSSCTPWRFPSCPRSNRTSSTAHNPTACATSSTNERLICAPWRLWQFSCLAASPGGNTCCAILGYCGP